MEYRDIHHLYLRAGFGATPGYIAHRIGRTREELVEELFKDSASFRSLRYLEDPVKGKKVGNVRLLFMILRSQEQMRELNIAWLDMLAEANGSLREKMTLFWHNHFATSTPLAWLMQVQNNTLRRYSLGNFKSLLHAVAKDPAMLIYLNNHQNKKDHPNENFAREVMELFTLGEGNYTEADIKEAARAFTGWTVSRTGQFELEENAHDNGQKELFGKYRVESGEEVLDILCQQDETAPYITRKIASAFIGEDVDDVWLNELSQHFRKTNYDISSLLKRIFLDDRFYEERYKGALISSPVELLVRYKRLISLSTRTRSDMLKVQKVLGQVLFFPPNVAGWPGGKTWIDTSSLRLRMDMASSIVEKGGFDLQPKPDFEDDPIGDDVSRAGKHAEVKSDWNTLIRYFKKYPEEDLLHEVMAHLLPVQPAPEVIPLLNSFIDHSSVEKRIISTCVVVMSLPEYQLI